MSVSFLWALLGIWLLVLGNDRVGNPLALPLPTPLLPIDQWIGAATADTIAATPAPPVANNPPTGAPAPAMPVNIPPPVPDKPETPAIVAPPPAKPAIVEKTPEPEKPSLPQTLPPDIGKRLANALARCDLASARAVLAENIRMDAAKLAEYRSAVTAIPDPLQLAEDTILASKGQEVVISYLGKDRKIIPRGVGNGEIAADFVAADGNRPVTFKTAKFTPDELLKLLPQQPEAPPIHAAVCLALLKANRKGDVAAHLPYCGVLGPVFEAAAATQP